MAEGVINGKAVLYMPDALPDFSAFAQPSPEVELPAEGGEEISEEPSQATQEGGEAPERIRRFADQSKPGDRNLRGKPVSREGGKRPAFRTGPSRPRGDGDSRPTSRGGR